LLAVPGLMLISNGGPERAPEEQGVKWTLILPRMPMIVLGAAFFALFDTLALSLLPLYAMEHGIGTDLALLSATVVLVGDTGLQFALGWMADRFGTRRVFSAAVAIFTLASILCGLSVNAPMLVAARCCKGWARP